MSDFKITDPTQGNLIIRTEENVSCECKIEVCYVDAVECGGSFHGYVDKRLVHFKWCFECRDLQSQLEAAKMSLQVAEPSVAQEEFLNNSLTAENSAFVQVVKDKDEQIDRLTAENERLNKRLVEILLKQAVNETAEVRRRLLESEQIPPKLWEMRFK